MSFGQSGDFGHYDSTIIGENQMQYISADTSYQLSSMVMEGRDFFACFADTVHGHLESLS